jgi:REP-associated tyrosine transposase
MSGNGILSSMSRWKTSKTAVFNLSYHLVWCPKYRRKVLVGDIKERLVELIHEKATELQLEIVEANIQPDHVHLFVRSKPIHSPQFVIGQLKGYTSRILRKEFATLRTRIPTLWTRSYYVDSVGKLNEYTIRKYIQEQDKK